MAAACDFDRDGDLDLFVGGRIVPGSFPLPADSLLLVNSEGHFENRIQDVADGLQNAGMVTSALWSDVNQDGWNDLLVAYEWGPVAVYVNEQGILKNQTAAAGIDSALGWYNSISGGDVDNDGDIDYVVGNTGLNSKYYATAEKPELIFYGEFGTDGKKNIVEAKYENGICLPRRGLGCTSDAIPIVKSKLPTYHEFAITDLAGIYTEDSLNRASQWKATELESLVLINQSTPAGVRFEIKHLPRIAQISPIFGSTLLDIDADGQLDLVVAQNFSGPQRETGNMNGGLSMAFRGNGDGTFEPIWPAQSGLVVTGDARSIALIDIDQDSRPEMVIGINDDRPVVLQNLATPDLRVIQLIGPPGNASGIGSRLELVFENGSRQAHEIYAGQGYLTQSTHEVFVSADRPLSEIVVHWPDGTQRQISDADLLMQSRVVIQHP